MTEQKTRTASDILKRPDQIKAYLDKYVVGQEEAKKTLSVAVYNHYKRILHKRDPQCKVNLEKSNVILLGGTGCGKTHMVKTIARMLGVPFYIGSATSLTASGYVGDDIESLLSGLLLGCNYNVPQAQMGIVFIDEIDKIAKKDAGVSITRDVSGECVQQGLLKMVEGHVMGVQPYGGRKHPEQPLINIDTTDILFVVSGAFVGLEDIVARRLGIDAGKIGYTGAAGAGKKEDILSEVSAQDLRDFGLIPEFVGRFPVVTHVKPLDKAALVKILTEPKDSLVAQYKELFRQDGFTLKFMPDALEAVAEKAIELKTGARGLRSILEHCLQDLMFKAPKTAAEGKAGEITITRAVIEGRSQARFKMAD